MPSALPGHKKKRLPERRQFGVQLLPEDAGQDEVQDLQHCARILRYPRKTRLSGAWTALIFGIVALVVILVFILQNLQGVELYFLVFHGHMPLAVALLFAVILGAIIVLAFGGGRIVQLRLVARRARRR